MKKGMTLFYGYRFKFNYEYLLEEFENDDEEEDNHER